MSPLHTSKSSSSFAPETHHQKNFKKRKKIFLRFGLSTKRYEFFDSGPKNRPRNFGQNVVLCFLIFSYISRAPTTETKDDDSKKQAEKEEEKIKKKRIAWRRGGRQRERDDVAHLRSDFERRSLRRLFSVNDGVPASEETRG